MSWGCYRHECDVDAPRWKAKVAALCKEQAASDDGGTWGSRQIGICPWCVEELMWIIETARDHAPHIIEAIEKRAGEIRAERDTARSRAIAKAAELGKQAARLREKADTLDKEADRIEDGEPA